MGGPDSWVQMGRARYLLYPGLGLMAKERATGSLQISFKGSWGAFDGRRQSQTVWLLVASKRRADAPRGETARAAAVER